jgi:hypothetical protein
MTKSEPSRNPSCFSKKLRIRGPRKKEKAQPGGKVTFPPACPMGAFIGRNGQKCTLKTRIWLGLRFNDYRSSKLNMIEDRVLEIKDGLWNYKTSRAIVFMVYRLLTHLLKKLMMVI